MAYTDIDRSSDYFNTITWTGDGTTKDITGVGFQPDLVWAKKRSATGYHAWCDAVRGGTKNIFSNDSIAEETSATDWILSFASDGFGVNSAGNLNQSSATYVAWNFLASNTTASNTDGSITSTVSANTTSGFSIVSYTGNGTSGATVGHGLGVAPKMFIVKDRTSAYPWRCWHYGLDNGAGTHEIYLNTTAVSGASLDAWNNTAPTSSVFSLGNGNYSNGSGDNFIAYCFAEKQGYSKFGSYTGNGNADGTFVYTGFRPAFVLTKSSSNSGASYNWQMWDNKRNTYNAVDTQLRPNTSESDNPDVSYSMDFVSNGFKMRGTNTNQNGSGSTYIYMCFAENPLVSSAGIPCTAR